MVIKSRFLILLLFLVGYVVFAQSTANDTVNTSDSSSYFIEETEEGTRFIQRLSWASLEGIIRYEMILDQRDGNSSTYNEFLHETTEEAFIDVSLPAGNYRYRVIGYNVLNRLGAESDYLYFEVFQAVQPVIGEISPAQLFLDDENRRITLSGERIVLGSEIFLVPIKRNSMDNSPDQEGVLVPAEINYSSIGNSAELVFDQDIPADKFRIVVLNPGGLFTTYESLNIKRFKDPLDINVSLGYAPLIPFYPFDPPENHVSNMLEKSFYPLGFTARISVIPLKTRFGFFGIELSPFFSSVNTDKGAYNIQANILGAALSLLYQKPFLDEKFFLNARMGGGLASYSGLRFEYTDGISTDPLSVIFPELQAGISAQYFIFQQVFVDLGLDVKFFFPQNMFTVYVSPTLTAGWRF
jgi:hypothetical protein